ncbi:hypothetical protein [Demequina sp. NBRC 110053]|uniref:hypothetical protein n=1 Tax=Demequina sp. NBRC 110053 TaxID=1570342 RepID=UPI000A06C145|nr:hypothetical protein [Demequina sp. NBRC 110053]
MPTWQLVAIGLIPSIAVGVIFWLAMRAVVRADRNERAALAAIEEADARAGSSADAPEAGKQSPGSVS